MNDHSPTHDLVIVGASFAGLIAAKTAAMRGLKVVVLESKPDAGQRVHTTGILVKEAAEIKSEYPISYAEAFCIATARLSTGRVLTNDPEFKSVALLVPIVWLSKKRQK